MALRSIMQYDTDDVLRKKSKLVREVNPGIVMLLEDMAETMYHADGAGLAAPQVGILRRLIVIDVGEGIIQLINPQIVDAQGEQIGEEGCLSIPGVWGIVKRPEQVVVKALDIQANVVELHETGVFARALCHEIDHLDGMLFIDKVEPGSIRRLSREDSDL